MSVPGSPNRSWFVGIIPVNQQHVRELMQLGFDQSRLVLICFYRDLDAQ
jgi:hypothetical protein